MTAPLLVAAFHDPVVTDLLSDAAYVRALCDVEIALARAQASLAIIPAAAAPAIEAAARAAVIDPAALRSGMERDGIPTLALIAALRAELAQGPHAEHAQYVHWGATSQDIMDTALVLQLRAVLGHFRASILQLVDELAELARAHKTTVLAARTHGQQALPTSFGLKVVGWIAPIVRHSARLSELEARLYQVQLGGAAGTLAALAPRGIALVEALATELSLRAPSAPWHTQRDTLAELGSWLSLLTGSLGKLAQDIILLTQTELAELAEGEPGQRGGSSSMPHKNNPMQSERILAAARANAALLSALHHALVQEQERATHGWQVEWLTLAPMLQHTAGALRGARELAAHLVVSPERMRQNLEHNHLLALSEATVGELARRMPRPEAFAIVKRASVAAIHERRSLIDVVRDTLARTPEHAVLATHIDWSKLAAPEQHLGHAEDLIDRVLAEAAALHVASSHD
jgi:3-carboxy-cis,cis-muconate cycloisomerase